MITIIVLTPLKQNNKEGIEYGMDVMIG